MNPTNVRIVVTLLGGGWAAVMVGDYDGYPEPIQTGIGRYRTSAEAVPEARSWAAADEVPYEGDDA